MPIEVLDADGGVVAGADGAVIGALGEFGCAGA